MLKIGCGNGRFWTETIELTPPGLQVVLTDLAEAMVTEARSACQVDGTPAVGSVVALPLLPFTDHAFDLAVSGMVMQHIADPDEAVREIARVLDPEGTLVVGAAGDRHLSELVELRRLFTDDVAPIGGRFGTGGLDAAARLVGGHFADVTWERYDDRLVVDDPDAVMDYLGSWPPFDGTDPDTLDRLCRTVEEHFAMNGGAMVITKDVGCIIATGPR